MLQLSFKSVVHHKSISISYTLFDTATRTELCVISGVMTREPRCNLLQQKQKQKQKQENEKKTVPVLAITWLHTNPLYVGFKYGACLMYLLALFAEKQYRAQYIILDDTTDVPPWHEESSQPCIGPERLVKMDKFMASSRFIQPRLRTLLSLVTLHFTIEH
jgi:hypothetical protein